MIGKQTFLLLIHEEVKKELLKLPMKERKKLLDKFSYLENGMWDSGVKVKKLKGSAHRVIFEGRLSKGDRILFTLGHEKDCACLYIWGTIHHDDIDRKSKVIIPSNAPFLHFEVEKVEELVDFVVEEMPQAYFTQEALEEKVHEDYGPQKWFEGGAGEVRRLLEKTHPDFYEMFLHLTEKQQEILRLTPPILLSGTAGSGKTTLAIYYLFYGVQTHEKVLFLTYHTYLKEFAQNLFNGLMIDSPYEEYKNRADFFVYKQFILHLLKKRKRHIDPTKEVGFHQFIHIFSKHALSHSYDAELVWEEIRSIIKGAVPSVSLRHLSELITRYANRSMQERDMNHLQEILISLEPLDVVKKIEKIIRHHTHYETYSEFIAHLAISQQEPNSVIILHEIVRILQNRTSHIETVMLSRNEYRELGKKRAPNFLYDRNELYEIALYYQKQLELTGGYDEIDLCRWALLELEGDSEATYYDLVVCDEIQDLSDIQLSLLFRLTKKAGNIVCAGDPKQIINPSGFRWEEVKSRFYERQLPVPEVQDLTLNFRSVGSIVQLSNALLKLKQRLVGISGYELLEDWKCNGRPPLVCIGQDESSMIKRAKRGIASKVVLVRSEKEKARLIAALDSHLVFTIQEAKGLEFDTVILWGFATEERVAKVWRRILDENLLQTQHYPMVKQEINLLYVAVTRARNTLIIYDGKSPSSIWYLPEIHAHLFISDEKESLEQMWTHISSKEEWKAQGDYYFAREQYKAAQECYRNALSDSMEQVCQAHILLQEGAYKEAAAIFVSHNRIQEAAHCFEMIQEYEQAAELYRKLSLKEDMHRCLIHHYEQNGKFEEAGDLLVKLKMKEQAKEIYKRGQVYIKLAHLYKKERSYEEAAHYYYAGKSYSDAALCYKRQKLYNKAADAFVKGGDYNEALLLFEKLKDSKGIMHCCIKLGDNLRIAQMHEKNKEYAEALQIYSTYVAHQGEKEKEALRAEAESIQEKGSNLVKAAIRFTALQMHKEAAELYERSKHYKEACDAYAILKQWDNAANVALKMKEPLRAVEYLENCNDRTLLVRARVIYENYLFSGYHYKRDRGLACYQEAREFTAQGYHTKALTRFMVLDAVEDVFETALRTHGRDEEVVDYFIEREKYEEACDFVRRKRQHAITVSYLKNLLSRYPQRNFYSRVYENSTIELLILILLASLYKRKVESELEEIVDQYLTSFSHSFIVFRDIPEELWYLILERRQYNCMLHVLQAHYMEESKIKKLRDNLLLQGEKLGDPLLSILGQKPFNQKLMDEYFAGVTHKNFTLFKHSPAHKKEVIDFFLAHGYEKEALDYYIDHKETTKAGKLLEELGDYRRAATLYRDENYFEDALRLYNELDDKPNCARVYERMKDYDSAISIWKELGKILEVRRVEAKREKEVLRQQKRKSKRSQ